MGGRWGGAGRDEVYWVLRSKTALSMVWGGDGWCGTGWIGWCGTGWISCHDASVLVGVLAGAVVVVPLELRVVCGLFPANFSFDSCSSASNAACFVAMILQTRRTYVVVVVACG